jgi:hypothetical protein
LLPALWLSNIYLLPAVVAVVAVFFLPVPVVVVALAGT